MSNKVLIVDDDNSICKLLQKVMTSNNLQSSIANDGNMAIQMLKTNTYDLILLDIMMNGMDGFEVVEKIREKGINTPIIIVSGRNEDYDVLYVLSLGADDYITKPFNPVLLGAKVKALIRRNKKEETTSKQILQHGRFRYDTLTFRFYKDNEEIILSSKENSLIHLFMERPNQVFTKDIIYEHVWRNAFVDENSIMVYINHLRNKIEDDPQNPVYIKTIRGIGYQFTPQ
jgi:DNA-binding response OmpR family regulator